MNAGLLLADVVHVDVVEAEVEAARWMRVGVLRGVGRDEHAASRHASGRTCFAASSKASTVSRSQHTGGANTFDAPLVVRDRERLVVGGRPAHVHLQHGGPVPPPSR